MPFTITMCFVPIEPPLVFLVFGEDQGSFALFHVILIWAIVLVVLSREVAYSMTSSFFEVPFINISFLVEKTTFSFHFSIRKCTLVNFPVWGPQLSST